jgi:tetraprenyl-beta-curcumene synthase
MSTTRHWSLGRVPGDAVVLLAELGCYWLTIFPLVSRELSRWRARARAIADPALREIAWRTLAQEGLNAEGAALFALLAPFSRRRAAARLLVRFQVLYDYLDALTERPALEPLRSSRQLHLALIAALGGPAPANGYFAHAPFGDDGGYLAELVAGCRAIFCLLPGAVHAGPHALRAARRSAEGQSQSHAAASIGGRTLISWAERSTPAGSGLSWWETAAATESSLVIHALLANAAHADAGAEEAACIAAAYWPWVTGLNALLDDLVDTAEDAADGTHSYVAHYADRDVTAARLGAIAARARRAVDGLPRRGRHAVILAAMTSFYLSAPQASDAEIGPVARRVRAEIGIDLRLLMAMLRVRRRLAGEREAISVRSFAP